MDKVLIEEIITTLKHASVFISSREKMHKTGIQLYDELIVRLESLSVLLDTKPAFTHACPTCSCFIKAQQEKPTTKPGDNDGH